jgi:hypothetical protein
MRSSVGKFERLRRLGLPPGVGAILLAGLVVRELFSFWTGQPYDLEVWIRTGNEAAHGSNPYTSFWPAVPGASFAYLNQTLPSAAYLPFWPALLGELFRAWLAFGGGDRFVLYFLLKQPGIVADMVSAYLLYRLAERWTGGADRAKSLLAFWSFFPYSIIITAIWGQFDSIVVALVLGLLFARNALERNLQYGLGILVKWFTVIFLPFEVLRERGLRRTGILVALAVPGAITLLLFSLEGWSFAGISATTVSQTHGGGLGMNYAFLLSFTYAPTGLSSIPDFYTAIAYVWIPGVTVAGVVAARWVRARGPAAELRALLLVVTVFMLLRWGLYEQYWLYLFALLALDVTVFHPGRRAFLLFTTALATIDLLVNNDLGIRFISPLSDQVQPFTASIDASSSWGVARTLALAVLAVVVTLTLVQFVRSLLRDEAAPRPWLYAVGSRPSPSQHEPGAN